MRAAVMVYTKALPTNTRVSKAVEDIENIPPPLPLKRQISTEIPRDAEPEPVVVEKKTTAKKKPIKQTE